MTLCMKAGIAEESDVQHILYLLSKTGEIFDIHELFCVLCSWICFYPKYAMTTEI